jgi:hypothetical protein
MHDGKRMKYLLLVLFAFCAPIPANLYAAESDTDLKSAGCVAFYELHKKAYEKASEKLFQPGYEGRLISNEDIQNLTELLVHQKAIADRAEECGPLKKEFYDEQATLCRGYILSPPDAKKFLEQRIKPFPYCDEALARGDDTVVVIFMHAYTNGQSFPKDYKKALYYVDMLANTNPKHPDALFFATPIYRQGGYGVEKDESKAFEILKNLASTTRNPKIFCELSLYHRNGIGTSKDDTEAEKWLNVYKKQNPEKECEFTDFSFMFTPAID